MNKKDELWRKIKIQIPKHRQQSKLQIQSTQKTNTNPITIDQISIIGDRQEQISPTFRRQTSLRSDVSQNELTNFSFGQKFLNQVQLVFMQQGIKNQIILDYSFSDLCCSFLVAKDKIPFVKSFIKQIAFKLTTFLNDTKHSLDQIKQKLMNEQQNLKSIVQFQTNHIKRLLLTVQNKHKIIKQELQKKLMQLQKQIYYKTQKQKIQQKKIYSLQNQIFQLKQLLGKQKDYSKGMHYKFKQNSQYFNITAKQNKTLLQQNKKLKQQLREIIDERKSFKVMMNDQQNKSNKSENQYFIQITKADNQSNKNQHNQFAFQCNRKYSKDSGFLSPKASSDIKQSFQYIFSHKKDNCVNHTPNRKYSWRSANLLESTNYQPKLAYQPVQAQKNCKENKNICSIQTSKVRRNSVIQTYSTPIINHITPQQSRITEKYQILSKIKRLKQNIKTDLQDMRKNSS